MNIKNISRVLSFLFSFVWLSHVAHSSTLPAEYLGKVISSISVTGNLKTQENIVQRELTFSVGNTLSIENIQESLRRLNNLRLFNDLTFTYLKTKAQTVSVNIHISERWTTIPIIQAEGGGSTKSVTLGLYDVNLLGRGLELGARIQSIDDQKGGVIWFRNPRLFDQRILLGADIWQETRNRLLYKPNGSQSGAYTNHKDRLHVFAKKELSKGWFIGTGIDYLRNDFDLTAVDSESLTINQSTGFTPPTNSEQAVFELSTQLGELNYDRYLVNGKQTSLEARLSREKSSSNKSTTLTLNHTQFYIFKRDHNLGIHLSLGHTNSDLLEDQFYLGGLSEIRGYEDRRFKGANFWKANLEYRIIGYQTSWLALQPIAFTDFGRVGDTFKNLLNSQSTDFASIGLGLRFIFPKVYRLNARIDFAKTLDSNSRSDVSFGLQQFF